MVFRNAIVETIYKWLNTKPLKPSAPLLNGETEEGMAKLPSLTPISQVVSIGFPELVSMQLVSRSWTKMPCMPHLRLPLLGSQALVSFMRPLIPQHFPIRPVRRKKGAEVENTLLQFLHRRQERLSMVSSNNGVNQSSMNKKVII